MKIMCNKYDVTIIVPVYNVEEYILECLQSITRQTNSIRIECLLIDDCGCDRSMAIVNSFLKIYKGHINFHVLYHEVNKGLSAARNTGIDAASGEYLYFLDSDDFISDDCIETMFSIAKEHEGINLVCGDHQTFPSKNLYPWLQLKNKSFPEYCDSPEVIRSLWLNFICEFSCNKLISRDWILSNKLYFKVGIVNEDTHWQFLTYSYVRSIAFVYKDTYSYRVREGSITYSQKDRTKHQMELHTAKLLEDALQVNSIFDSTIVRLIVLKLLYLKSCTDSDSKQTFSKIILTVLKNKYINNRLRAFLYYIRLPRPIMRYSIAEIIIRFSQINAEYQYNEKRYNKEFKKNGEINQSIDHSSRL